MDAEDLLKGPRGRRLCLEWAKCLSAEQARGHDRLWEALSITGSAMDPSGTSWVFAARESDDGPEPELPPPSTPEEIADLIAAVGPRRPTAHEALRLLSETTGWAVYWQPLWGEDRLAATGPVRRVLTAIAESITGANTTSWWGCAADPARQRSTRDIPPEGSGETLEPPADDAEEALRCHRSEVMEEERHLAQADSDDVYGHWDSIPGYDLVSSTRCLEGIGPVGLWGQEDGTGADLILSERVIAPRDPHILEITGPQAWIDLCARYPLEVSAGRRYVWRDATGRTGRWVVPDWPDVAASGVDGVHLSVAGYLTTAGRALPLGGERATVLAGWGPDATYWFTDVATADPAVWQLDHDHEERHDFHLVEGA